MPGGLSLADLLAGLLVAFLMVAGLGWYLKGRGVWPSTPRSRAERKGRYARGEVEMRQDWSARAKVARYLMPEDEAEPAGRGVVERVLFYRPGVEQELPFATQGELVGRKAELRELLEALRRRVPVLLWGQEGVGRSALAREVIGELAAEFSGGTLWLRVGRASLWAICNAIAWALGDEVIPILPPERRVLATRALLEGRDVLLVLDEVERIRSATSLLESCLSPTVALLTIGLAPFSGFGLVRELQCLPAQDAVGLFTQTAPQSSDEGERVGRICRLLGNHPLSISIAAGLVSQGRKSLAELLRELEEEVGRAGRLAGPERWMAMIGAILLRELEDEERELWLDLASLPSHAAGPELLGVLAEAEVQSGQENLQCLSQLGLVEEEGGRYRLHPLVARLAVGEDAEMKEREERAGKAILDYVLRYASRGKEGEGALEAEIANILGEMERSYHRAQWERYLELVDALSRPVTGFLGVQGRWDEILRHARQAYGLARSQGWELACAHYASFIAMIQLSRGYHPEARHRYQEALGIFRRAASRQNVALTLQQLGRVAEEEGTYAEARGYLKESLRTWQDLGDERSAAMVEWALGNISYQQDQYEEAGHHYHRALAAFQELGDERNQAGILHQLGIIAQSQGDEVQAREYYEQSLNIKRKYGDRWGIGSTLHNLASVLQVEGDLTKAEELYRESLEIAQRAGNREGTGIILHQLGRLAQEQGDMEAAQGLYRDSTSLAREEEAWTLVAENLEDLGALAQEAGKLSEAAIQLEEALELRKNLGEEDLAASILYQLGAISLQQDEHLLAERHFLESLRLAREQGNRTLEASNLCQLGEVKHRQGDYPAAKDPLAESLRLYQELEDRTGQAQALQSLGQVAYQQAYYGEARRLYEEALGILRELGKEKATAALLLRVAEASLAQGYYNQAQRLCQESLELSREREDQLGMARALAQLARLSQRLRRAQEARELIQEAAQLLEGVEGGGELYRELLDELQVAGED